MNPLITFTVYGKVTFALSRALCPFGKWASEKSKRGMKTAKLNFWHSLSLSLWTRRGLPPSPRYDSELHNAADLEGEGGGDRERALLQQLKLLREEKAHLKVRPSISARLE